MKIKIILSIVVACLSWMLGSCGSNSSGGITDLNSLPAAVGPVVSSSSINSGVQLFSATTGVTLADFGDVSWSGTSKSRPFCEIGRLIKESYMQISEPDKITCYIAAMKENGAFPTDIDDGNYKYYQLSGAGRPGGGAKLLKFKVVKDSSGNIQSFEMFACNQNRNRSTTQDMYASKDVSNLAAANITAKFGFSAGGVTFSSGATATGAVNTDGDWTSKTITMSNVSSFSSRVASSFRQQVTVTQNATTVTATAFMAGDHSSDSFSNRLYGVVQTLNTDSMATYALGDGSAQFAISHTHLGTTYSQTGTKSWLGDTQEPLSDATQGEQYTTASSGTLPTVLSQSDISAITAFTTAQTWDCEAEDSFETTSASGNSGLRTALQACNTKYGGERRGWVECRDATGL